MRVGTEIRVTCEQLDTWHLRGVVVEPEDSEGWIGVRLDRRPAVRLMRAIHVEAVEVGTIERARIAAENLSDKSCSCWDFGDGDEWPHKLDADGNCTPYSRRVQA